MFKIDIKTICENFTKTYGTETEGIKCYKTCCGIVLYGAGFEDSEYCMGGLSLSVDTAVAIKTNELKKFGIIFSDMNTQYECETQNLKAFVSDKIAKSIFKCCAMTRGNVNGAEILIEYSINKKQFQRPATALISGLGILNNGKTPDIELAKCLIHTDEELYSFLPAELYGRKNTLINKEKNGNLEYFPFNLNGYKIVLSVIDEKGFDIKNILFKSNNKKFEKYIKNEEERIELIKSDILQNGVITNKLAEMLKSSSYELLEALGKSAEKLFQMYKISEKTGLAKAIVPMYSYFGICAFVADENVDNYAKRISKEYQKKVGTIPTLCICDSGDSGIEIRH